MQALSAQFSTKEILGVGRGNAETIINATSSTRYVIAGKGNQFAYASEVNRIGIVFRNRDFKNVIGPAIRSEFTDVVNNGSGYTFVGDCDSCDVGSGNARVMMVLQTDRDFNVSNIVKLDVPMGSEPNEEMFGWQKIKQDGNGYIVASQLTKLSGQDTLSNIALTKFDANLDVLWHKRYDWDRYDNLGDLEVRDGNYYLLTWGIDYFGIGGDSMSIHVIDGMGNGVADVKYPGVGFALSQLEGSTDWIVGGALTTDINVGPQCLLMRLDEGATLVNRSTFGTAKIDAIRDVEPTSDGNILISATFDQEYPDLATILANDDYLSYEEVDFPNVTSVHRVNSNTLQVLSNAVLPNSPNAAVIIRNVLPLNSTGSIFVSSGYQNNRSMFFSRTLDNSNLVSNGTTTKSISLDATMNVFPNPASLSQRPQIEVRDIQDALNLQIFDMTGRLATELNIEEEGMYPLSLDRAGIYILRLTDKNGLSKTTRLTIID